MNAIKRNIAALVLVAAAAGLVPVAAQAHRMFERVYDPDTGETFRQSVSHRHRSDGSVVILDNTYRANSYSSSTYSPYYSSGYARPYGYSSGYSNNYYGNGYGSPYYGNNYYNDGYRRNGGNNIGQALLGAGIGYAIDRARR